MIASNSAPSPRDSPPDGSTTTALPAGSTASAHVAHIDAADPAAHRDRAEDAIDPAATLLERAVAEVIAANSGTFPKSERRTRRMGVNRAFRAVKAQHAADRTLMERVAERLTTMVSSPPFLLLHALWFGGWILWNTGTVGLHAFDPYPFGLLTMIVSLEAIFLSLFVLMSQSRESAIAELREEVTLQVNLRMEEEVTKTLQLVAGLYTRLGQKLGEDDELRDMLKPLDALAIEKELIEQIRDSALSQRQRKAKAGAGLLPSKAAPEES